MVMSRMLIGNLKLSLWSTRLGKLANVYNVRRVHAQSDLIVRQSAIGRVDEDQLVVMNITYVRHSLLSENLMKHTHSSNKWTFTLHGSTTTYTRIHKCQKLLSFMPTMTNPICMTSEPCHSRIVHFKHMHLSSLLLFLIFPFTFPWVLYPKNPTINVIQTLHDMPRSTDSIKQHVHSLCLGINIQIMQMP